MTIKIVAAMLAAVVLLPGTVLGQDGGELLSHSRQAATALTQQLAAQLKAELGNGEPEAAIRVSRDVAPEIAGRLSRERGWRVARMSLETRNPLLGMPDAWEQAVLADFDRLAAAGQKHKALEHAEVVEGPSGRYYRYMKAIPVQPLCLACHGSRAAIAPGVAAALRADYPHDQATGEVVDQIRGAVTIKQPLP